MCSAWLPAWEALAILPCLLHGRAGSSGSSPRCCCGTSPGACVVGGDGDLRHPPLGYAVAQGLLEAGVNMCEQVQGLEGHQCSVWGSSGCLGQLCSEREGHRPAEGLRWEARLVCPAPPRGNELPLSLPLIPAGREQFNPLHFCPPAGRSWWDPLGQRCWQRQGVRLAQMDAHLPGFQGGSLPSLTDPGRTMGRDAHAHPASHASPVCRSTLWQGRAPRAAWP